MKFCRRGGEVMVNTEFEGRVFKSDVKSKRRRVIIVER